MEDDDRKEANQVTGHRIRYGVLTFCVVLVFADAFYHKHAKFGVEEWFGFYAAYGFIAALAAVLVAKILRRLVTRPADYYDKGDD